MLAVNPLRERLVEEIRQIPDTKSTEVLDELKHCIRQPNPAPHTRQLKPLSP